MTPEAEPWRPFDFGAPAFSREWWAILCFFLIYVVALAEVLWLIWLYCKRR